MAIESVPAPKPASTSGHAVTESDRSYSTDYGPGSPWAALIPPLISGIDRATDRIVTDRTLPDLHAIEEACDDAMDTLISGLSAIGELQAIVGLSTDTVSLSAPGLSSLGEFQHAISELLLRLRSTYNHAQYFLHQARESRPDRTAGAAP